MTWLGHSCVAGRKEDRGVVWTAGKGGDLEQVGGRESGDDVVEKVLWFSKGKTFTRMMESLTLMLYF